MMMLALVHKSSSASTHTHAARTHTNVSLLVYVSTVYGNRYVNVTAVTTIMFRLGEHGRGYFVQKKKQKKNVKADQ